jgi:hypothetical protein
MVAQLVATGDGKDVPPGKPYLAIERVAERFKIGKSTVKGPTRAIR